MYKICSSHIINNQHVSVGLAVFIKVTLHE